MGRKKLSEDVDIKYFTIRINGNRYPYLADFLRGNENTNNLVCTLLQSSKTFIRYMERRRNDENVFEEEPYFVGGYFND
jgi:hypothetical protein